MSSEEGEPAVLERSLTPLYIATAMNSSANGLTSPIVSFAWHPSQENILTTKSGSGKSN